MPHLLLCICCLLGAALSAQTDTTQAPFIAYWSPGDTYSFDVAKINNVYVNDAVTKSDTSRYRSTFEVVDSTADTYTIKYSFGQHYYSTQAVDPIVADALDSFALDYLFYTTDTYGRFRGLKNWETFAEAMNEGIEAAAESLFAAHPEMDAAVFRSVLDPLRSVYTSESGILNKLAGELQHFHLFYGGAYTLNDTLRFVDSLGNMFGGTPFPIDSELFLEELDYANQFAVVRHVNLMQPQGSAIFRKTMQQAYPEIAGTDGSAFDGMDFDIRDDNWYAFYYNPGIPYRIENDRWTTLVAADKRTVTHERLLVALVE